MPQLRRISLLMFPKPLKYINFNCKIIPGETSSFSLIPGCPD
ncbi:Uncharacterized protein dnm_051770 [Desulfonema magnum]|uniref:Uncharacterized protein n=1 Tax=Desulfonema magnum TaxID=45655 RepID=A0A975GPS4_9BACT|nr:Uncharacterized protein dnm_051770 [Desulfonema magnum]